MTDGKENPSRIAPARGSGAADCTVNRGTTLDADTQALMRQPIACTIFPNVGAKTKRAGPGTWGELVALLQDPPERASKGQCELMVGAEFGANKTAANSLRDAANVGLVSFVEGDYDNEEISPQEAAARLQEAGVEAVIYTTASHTTGRPRWRVIALLSTPCRPSDRRLHVASLNGALGDILAPESFTLSQSYYFGQVERVAYEFHHVRGAPIDSNLFVSEIYPRGVSSAAFEIVDDDNGLENLPEVVSTDTVADLACAIRAMPDAWADDYEKHWRPVLQALKHLAWCGPADEAEALAREFSQRSAKFNEEYFSKKWERQLRPWKGHYKTIFKLAQAEGWVNPRARPDVKAVIARMMQMPVEELKATWAAEAAQMTSAGIDELKTVVHRVTGIGLRALGAELKQAKADHKRDRTTLTAAGRLILTYRPEDSARQTSEVEARILRDAPPEEMFVYAGRPSRLVEAELDHSYHMDRGERSAPPPVLLIEAYTDVAMRALAEGHTVFQGEGASGPYNIAIPPTTVSMLRELPSASVPRVRGILVHPIALPDGTLLATNGLHKPTGLFVHGVSAMDVRPYTRAEAVQAWARLNHSFLSGFEFAGTLQAHIALAGLFTAVQRRLMDCAPGLMILAPIQSAGKTTLARRIHGVLTGRDMPVVTLTVGNDEEIEKRLLAMLLRSPAMVTFDNIPDGLTVNCGAALNSALTSPVFDGRLLGSTQMLQVPTNVFFVVTGNNLRLGKDEVSRWLTTVLAPAHARPQDRSFRHPDVMGHALSIRDQVLRDVVGIASGYLASGDRVSLDTGTRFPQWETMVRKPIVWAGGEDVARSFTINGEDSEHDQALRMLLTSLREAHGDRTFYARDVVDLASGFLQADGGETYRRVQDALEMLGARDVTKALSVGRVLAGYADRPVSIHDETLRLRARDDRNRVRCYLVETCGGCGI